jgi:hypothetical protein
MEKIVGFDFFKALVKVNAQLDPLLSPHYLEMLEIINPRP